MNNILLKFKNKIKNIFSFRKINPHNHWKILLYIFAFVVIILISFSFYLLSKMKNQQITTDAIPQKGESVLLNEKLLNKVTEYFDSKQIKENEIKNGVKVYKDPSI